ncbi:hypothetical protein [Dyadobacter frigoris]|uniref:Uncharacterized protein n=1 Tax=Dyadobacter frigoris TaxID=2576211 RepID=A0A4U6CXF6_9BACT|nr:hypothetical protein [Dyadobacter frigoris]TKT89489.1 hypothetical protein FDK13_24410 [Dyadobacter frigoris]
MKNLLFVLLFLFATSCVTYKNCERKFSKSVVADSVKIMVPVSVLVPKDSVILSFKTDTTYLYKEIQQGRAKVIVERTHTITQIKAECDTVTIYKKVPYKVPGERVIWGVAPWHKDAFRGTLIALILSIVYIFFNKFFTTQRRSKTQ